MSEVPGENDTQPQRRVTRVVLDNSIPSERVTDGIEYIESFKLNASGRHQGNLEVGPGIDVTALCQHTQTIAMQGIPTNGPRMF